MAHNENQFQFKSDICTWIELHFWGKLDWQKGCFCATSYFSPSETWWIYLFAGIGSIHYCCLNCLWLTRSARSSKSKKKCMDGFGNDIHNPYYQNAHNHRIMNLLWIIHWIWSIHFLYSETVIFTLKTFLLNDYN